MPARRDREYRRETFHAFAAMPAALYCIDLESCADKAEADWQLVFDRAPVTDLSFAIRAALPAVSVFYDAALLRLYSWFAVHYLAEYRKTLSCKGLF